MHAAQRRMGVRSPAPVRTPMEIPSPPGLRREWILACTSVRLLHHQPWQIAEQSSTSSQFGSDSPSVSLTAVCAISKLIDAKSRSSALPRCASSLYVATSVVQSTGSSFTRVFRNGLGECAGASRSCGSAGQPVLPFQNGLQLVPAPHLLHESLGLVRRVPPRHARPNASTSSVEIAEPLAVSKQRVAG